MCRFLEDSVEKAQGGQRTRSTDSTPYGGSDIQALHRREPVGKGDFGNIYLVRYRRDEQKLFALAESINSTKEERYRFTLDYVSLAPLDRRVLPHIQYAFNDDKLNRAYVLMSYIEELNLEILRLQQLEKLFPLPHVIITMTLVINAIAYLHGRRPPVIHRNIKPTNIIVVPPDALYRSAQLGNEEIDPLKPVNEVIPAIPTLIAEVFNERCLSTLMAASRRLSNSGR